MDTLAQILSIIGCLNWGLIGLFQFDLVAWLLADKVRSSAVSSMRSWAWPAYGASHFSFEEVPLWMGNKKHGSSDLELPYF